MLFWSLAVAGPLHILSCLTLRFLLRRDSVLTQELFADSRLMGRGASSYSLLRGRYLLPWNPVKVSSNTGLARRVLPIARFSGMITALVLAAMLPVFFSIVLLSG